MQAIHCPFFSWSTRRLLLHSFTSIQSFKRGCLGMSSTLMLHAVVVLLTILSIILLLNLLHVFTSVESFKALRW